MSELDKVFIMEDIEASVTFSKREELERAFIIWVVVIGKYELEF